MKYAVAAAAILLCATPGAAAPKETQPAKLKKINIVALDAQGQPVTGLHSTDFQLLEDGKPRDIAFLRFTGGQLAAKPGPGEYSNRIGIASHTTVVLIDLLSDRIMSDSTLGREIIDALKNLESSDGLYLYFLTPHGELYPIHPLPKPDTTVAPTAEPWTRAIAPMVETAIKELFGKKPVDNRDFKVRYDLTMKALEELGGQMGEISGRKNLVWVTHGVPIDGFSLSTQARLDFTNRLRWFCEALEQAQIVVYTVEQSMAGAAAAIGTSSAEILQEIAGITGGRQYSSDRAGEAIQQARTDSRANYQLGWYSSSLNPDGKHHKLRLTCARKEVRLQTEHGFYALAPGVSPADLPRGELQSREMQPEVEAAAHSPFDATEIGLRASASPDPAAPQNMRLEVHIDAADLLPRPARDQDAGKVSVVFVSYDVQDQPARPTMVTLTPEQFAAAAQGEITLREDIPVGEAVRKVRAIVFDAQLRAVGSVTIPISRGRTRP